MTSGFTAETRPRFIGVIGGSECSQAIRKVAEAVGRGIAQRGDIVVCGGLTGVMEAVCRGAKTAHGLTVGILPGDDKTSANRYVDIPIVTGIGYARNIIVVKSSNGIIAIGGKYGTLSEIAFASSLGVPLVGISTWEVEGHMVTAQTPEKALKELYSKL